MDIKKKKISFNYITFDYNSDIYDITEEVQKILEFAAELERKDRKLDLSIDKFCILDSSETINENINQLIFKSAKHSYRAPLLDRQTINERDNPKTLSEGETKKTHFIVKYKDGDALLLAEKHRGGLAVLEFIMYLNSFKILFETTHGEEFDYKFSYETIIKDNIDEELEKMSRVQSTLIYVDKQLLGGNALNFSERLETVQESIIIDIRASRAESIKETAKELLAKFNGGERRVNKIRIKGKNSTDNDVVLDTSYIEKREHIDAYLNEDTGEVNSTFFMSELSKIAHSM